MTKEESKSLYVESEKTCAYLACPLPEPRQKLLDLLLADEARDFGDCMRGHFESLARFIPVMDEIVKKSKGKHT